MRLDFDNQLRRLEFAPHVSIEAQGNKVLLTASDDYVVLEGELCGALIPLLQKGLSVDEIMEALEDRYPPADLYFMMMRLADDGYLVEHDSDQDPSYAGYWSMMGYNPGTVSDALMRNTIGVTTLGLDEGFDIGGSLADMQIQLDPEAGRRLILTSSYLHPGLEAINEDALRNGISFLLAKPAGPVIWLGPVIQPSRTGCWACLKHRLELNQPAEVYRMEQGHSSQSHNASAPLAMQQIALGMIALETAKWLASPEPFHLEQTLVSFDLRSLEIQNHHVVRQPRCGICGSSLKTEERTERYDLSSCSVKKTNSYRLHPPNVTLQRLEHHVSPITGIVRSLERIETGSTELTYNYTAGHSGRRKGHSIDSLRLATRDQSGGKGRTDTQARVSGLCEALERYSAVYDDDPIDMYASYREMEDTAIHPQSLLLFSESQYENRESWNARQSGHFQLVPLSFDESANIAWTEAWSLTHNTYRYVPSSYCYYGFDGPGVQYCKADSNGLASGNSLEEAIMYAILELAERDAVSMWWYNRIRHPEVDYQTFDEPYFDALRTFYQTLNRDLWVLDVTNDLGIPTFVAVSPRREGESEDILMGFGAHFDAKMAITRAMLEVNQSLPAVLKSPEERRNQLLPDFADVLNWWNTASVDSQSYLRPADPCPPKTVSDYDSVDEVDLKERIERYVAGTRELGLEIIVLDMTRPDTGLSVARVMIPGLRHFWRRLAPGRLYEVPVMMGWRDDAPGEDQLNPISLFL